MDDNMRRMLEAMMGDRPSEEAIRAQRIRALTGVGFSSEEAERLLIIGTTGPSAWPVEDFSDTSEVRDGVTVAGLVTLESALSCLAMTALNGLFTFDAQARAMGSDLVEMAGPDEISAALAKGRALLAARDALAGFRSGAVTVPDDISSLVGEGGGYTS